MVRTQIQLPDPLYKEVQRVAREQDWSIAEVIRRGAESVICSYPGIKEKVSPPWRLPTPINAKMLIHDPDALRAMICEDSEGHGVAG